jgi:uncharacterized membrane protein YkvA (DUF1232 family)
MFWSIVMSILASLLFVWLAFVVVLVAMKPEPGTLHETARIVPDAIRLVRRLAADRSLHRGVRVRLWLLLAYLASPIDLIPDFIPLLGYADDAIITSLVLRSVIKRAGVDEVRGRWPGTPDGLSALAKLCRIPQLGT